MKSTSVRHYKNIFSFKSYSLSTPPSPKSPVSSAQKLTGNSFETIPIKLQCQILKNLTQSELLTFRLICHSIKETIEAHFIFNIILNDVNVSRSWSPGIQLPWSQKIKRKVASDGDLNLSKKDFKYFKASQSITVGLLLQNFTVSLSFVASSIKQVEFTQPITLKNLRKILKECWALQILRIHSSVFIGQQNSCTKAKYAKLEIDVNQLSRLYIILDDKTMTDETPCKIPYWLRINLAPPSESTKNDLCEIQFIPQGLQDDCVDVFKTWIVDDEIIDIFSRPDILRKITYFATVTEAELRQITIKFFPRISIPSCIHFTKILNHPGFYPQLKKYPVGPFNGTMLTYYGTKRKRIFTYTPIHLHSNALVMNFSDAAQLLLSERANS